MYLFFRPIARLFARIALCWYAIERQFLSHGTLVDRLKDYDRKNPAEAKARKAAYKALLANAPAKGQQKRV